MLIETKHGISLDEKLSPLADEVINKFNSLKGNDAVDFVDEIASLAAYDSYQVSQGLPRENGNAIEQDYILSLYLGHKLGRYYLYI